jgi:cysteine desulfurase
MIYLDNNATTRVAPEVFEAMRPYLGELFGNPSSAHSLGRTMKQAIEKAREQVAALIGAADTSEVVFTSCGSESDNWAIRSLFSSQPAKRHIVTTLVEHEAVRNVCRSLESEGYEVTWLGVNEQGELNLDDLRAALRPDTALVSIMLANNETGVLFPINEIGRIVRERSEALFHVDGVQAVGKLPIDLENVDLFALSGHKLHAPQGIGALYVRKGISLPSFIIGGAQEHGRRAGTSAVPNIVGLGAACKLAHENGYDSPIHSRIQKLRDRLESEILKQVPNARLNGHPTNRLPNTSNISFEYVEGQNILLHLDQLGICVSTGSACHSTSHESSPTLRAMNVPYTAAQGSIRFSLGRYNTDDDVETTLSVLPGIIDKLAAMSPYDQELHAKT